jgi:acetyltransferase-like isoleucine patch superfamily enzyme
MKPDPRPIGRLKKHLIADPFPWAIWLLFNRALSKLRSAYLGWLFRAPRLHLGPGCRINGTRFIRFGSNLYIHGNLWLHAITTYNDQRFRPLIEIGDQVSISERVHITCIERIRIGNRVVIGSGTYIGDHHHGVYRGPEQSRPDTPPAFRPLGGGGPVIIGDDVWIGDNAVIIGPVSIGRGSIIGANSVVRRDVPDQTIAAGVPARPIKQFKYATSQWERICADGPKDTLLAPDEELRDSRA